MFYRSDGRMVAVPVTTDPEFDLGRPTELFSFDRYVQADNANYAVDLDGQRFLMVAEDPSARRAARTYLVLNWFEELKRLVPTGR